MSSRKKLEKAKRLAAQQETLAKEKVLMRFHENKYYNDLERPIFEAGKIYELEGASWIQRWLKRGGEIVEEAKKVDKPSHQKPIQTVSSPDPSGEEIHEDSGHQDETDEDEEPQE